MQYTESFNLQKPDYNNIVDISVLNQNFDRIDKGLVLNAGYSTGDNNTYVLTIPDIEKLTSEDIGASFKFFAHKDSTGYVSIKINDGEAKPLYDGKKKQVKKILTGVPYTIVWDGFLNFFLASGGVDESDETTVGTDGSKVLEGETFIGSDGEIHTGTMPNIGHQTATINAGGRVTISKGYHDGTGYVQANTMAKQMQDLGSTLTSASQLVSGVKAVDKNGNLITGTATIQSLGGLIVQQGSGNYTPSYGLNYDRDAVETMTLTFPLNLTFQPKVLIISYDIHKGYAGTERVTDVLNSYTGTLTKGVVNYSTGSSSSGGYGNKTTCTAIGSIPKDNYSMTASSLNHAGTWRFPYSGSVYKLSGSDKFTPLPVFVSWTAIG